MKELERELERFSRRYIFYIIDGQGSTRHSIEQCIVTGAEEIRKVVQEFV